MHPLGTRALVIVKVPLEGRATQRGGAGAADAACSSCSCVMLLVAARRRQGYGLLTQ